MKRIRSPSEASQKFRPYNRVTGTLLLARGAFAAKKRPFLARLASRESAHANLAAAGIDDL
jgi:hypothetical protein